MIHMDTDGFANHARGHGIKNPFDFQGTAARHFQAELAMVHEAFTGECLTAIKLRKNHLKTTWIQLRSSIENTRIERRLAAW